MMKSYLPGSGLVTQTEDRPTVMLYHSRWFWRGLMLVLLLAALGCWWG